ncbi:hypothetical protein ACOSQ2_010395 [Xanthoceras sorbifolium]
MVVLDRCKGCRVADESVLHALWKCPALKVIRGQCSFVKQQVCSPLDSSSFLDFFVSCCSIWYRRNNLVHSKVLLLAIDVVSWSRVFLAEFSTSNLLSSALPAPCTAIGRCKPPLGWMKLNVDASLKPENSLVRLGAVLRDHEGLFLAGLSRKLVGLVSIEVVEASTILNGIHLAIESGFNHFMVESDALNVIKYINSRSPPLSEVGLIIADIFAISSTVDVVFAFVPRGCNSVAHLLAGNSFSISDVSIWLEDAPP